MLETFNTVFVSPTGSSLLFEWVSNNVAVIENTLCGKEIGNTTLFELSNIGASNGRKLLRRPHCIMSPLSRTI